MGAIGTINSVSTYTDVITKSDILTRVNKICKRNETDIDDILLESLNEIARKTLCLKESVTSTTVANQNYISKPDGMLGNTIDGLVIDGSPLDPIAFWQLLKEKFNGYCVHNGKIYFYPYYSDAKSYTLYYSKLHPSDLTTIIYPSEYMNAIVHLVASKLYEKYENYEGVSAQLTLFENEILSFTGYNTTPPVAQYNGQDM